MTKKITNIGYFFNEGFFQALMDLGFSGYVFDPLGFEGKRIGNLSRQL
jgi:hypothetical protein